MAFRKPQISLDERQRVLMVFLMTAGRLRLFDLARFDANRAWRLLRWMAGKYGP